MGANSHEVGSTLSWDSHLILDIFIITCEVSTSKNVPLLEICAPSQWGETQPLLDLIGIEIICLQMSLDLILI